MINHATSRAGEDSQSLQEMGPFGDPTETSPKGSIANYLASDAPDVAS